MEYDEDGIRITNFENCDEEATGGWSKNQVENDITIELLKEANKIANL